MFTYTKTENYSAKQPGTTIAQSNSKKIGYWSGVAIIRETAKYYYLDYPVSFTNKGSEHFGVAIFRAEKSSVNIEEWKKAVESWDVEEGSIYNGKENNTIHISSKL